MDNQKDKNVISVPVQVLPIPQDAPVQIMHHLPPGVYSIVPSMGIELIKSVLVDTGLNLWKYNGRYERLQRLNEYHEKVKIALETAKMISIEDKKKIDTNILNKCIPLFHLSYYGENVAPIIKDVIALYRELFASFITHVNEKANVDKNSSMNNKVKKILFLSDRLATLSSVMKDRAMVIAKCAEDKEHFIVDIMTRNAQDEISKRLIHSKVNKIHHFSEVNGLGDIKKDIDTIIENRYDIIVYCDCHMSDKASALSLFRLAPFQFSTWGHSETTGTCDAYFCNEMYETSDINIWSSHYAEPKLFVQKSMGSIYLHPISPDVRSRFQGRDFFQLPKNKKIYLSTSSLFKMGSEMLEIFKKILETDKNGIIVVTKLNTNLDTEFYKDVEAYIGDDLISRFYLISRQDGGKVANLVNNCDVFIESYPFGNYNSSLECFELGIPVVSWSTDKMNSRYTRAMYMKMGMENDGLLVNSIDEYVNCAVKIANNKLYGDLIRHKIKLRNEMLFGDTTTWDEWKDILYNYCSTEDTSKLTSTVKVYDNVNKQYL